MPLEGATQGEAVRAALVIPIIAGTNPSVLFVRRAAHLRRSPGDIAFPGGLTDADDGSELERTALREFEEELGVERSAVELVYRLPDALVINGTVLVSPFVGVLAERPLVRIDTREIDGVLEVPLHRLLARGAIRPAIEPLGRLRIPTCRFDDGRTHIWGATARILVSLGHSVAENNDLRATLAGHGIRVDAPA